jgi:hypothetical protein
MEILEPRHVDDEKLDMYVLKRLPAKDNLSVRLHLRRCSDCAERAWDAAVFADIVRAALRQSTAA